MTECGCDRARDVLCPYHEGYSDGYDAGCLALNRHGAARWTAGYLFGWHRRGATEQRRRETWPADIRERL